MDDLGGRTDEQQDGGQGRRPRRWRLGATVTAGAAAAVIGVVILVGLTSAGAQTTSPSAPATPGQGVRPAGGPRGFGPGMWDHHDGFGGPGMPGGVLHGEFTTVDPNGGYRTVDVQTGAVTAVSASSITVKSQDGFIRTYVVNTKTMVDAGRDGIANVKVGHTVHLQATVTGTTATAVVIFDQSNAAQMPGRWMPPGPGGAAWPAPTATTGA